MNDHLVDFGERGWAIQHPERCKPNMLDCDVHQRFLEWMDQETGPPVALGRYELSDELVIGERAVAVRATPDTDNEE